MSITTYETRDEWLTSRAEYLGASEVAAALGQSPYKSMFALWAEKTTGQREESDSEAAEWGAILEPVVIRRYAEKSGRDVSPWNQNNCVTSDELPFLRCTPDATQVDEELGPGTLQVKTTSAYLASDWASEPPLHVQIQAQIEAWILGYSYGTVAALIGGQKLVWHDFKVNKRFISAVIPKLEWFWNLVQTNTQPDIDGSESTTAAIRRLYESADSEPAILTADVDALIQRRKRIKDRQSKADKVVAEIENRIKAAMIGHDNGTTPAGAKVTYREQQRKGYTVEPSVVRTLRITSAKGK